VDGKEDKGWRELGKGERALADDYDYVCYGKVYQFDQGINDTTDRVYIPPVVCPTDDSSVYMSYGALLMNMEGSYRKLSKLAQDNVYLPIRK